MYTSGPAIFIRAVLKSDRSDEEITIVVNEKDQIMM